VGIGCKVHFAAQALEILGWLLKLSYRTAGTVVAGLHRRHKSIAGGHTLLVGCCRYRNSQLYQRQPGH
jgi:hypothetical protein